MGSGVVEAPACLVSESLVCCCILALAVVRSFVCLFRGGWCSTVSRSFFLQCWKSMSLADTLLYLFAYLYILNGKVILEFVSVLVQ